MKKMIFLFVLAAMFLSIQSYAGSGDLFNYDKEKVSMEMADLNALEAMVSQDQSISYEGLLEINHPLVNGLDTESGMMMPGMVAGPVIPSFWWGCIFGPIGVLVVYLVEEDRDETRSAIWGCVLSALLSGAFSGLYWGIWAASAN